jgi:ppGpp synthetase/RelA/SpoT-type nucleotidyltranferase
MEKKSWTERVNNEAVLHRVKEERNLLKKTRRRKANWIRHILCRNCLPKHITEGKVSGKRRRGRDVSSC